MNRLDAAFRWAIRTHVEGANTSLDDSEDRDICARGASAATMLLWTLGGDCHDDMLIDSIAKVRLDLENTAKYQADDKADALEHMCRVVSEASVRLQVIQNILWGAEMVMNRVQMPTEMVDAINSYDHAADHGSKAG